MSAINQMLRDLDRRGALAQGAAAPGTQPVAPDGTTTAPNKLAGAYASVRMLGPRTRVSRNVLLAAGVAALLPIAWATTYFERPAVGAVATTTAAEAVPATPTQAPATAAPVRAAVAPEAPVVAVAVNATPIAPGPAPAAAPVAVAVAAPVVAPVAAPVAFAAAVQAPVLLPPAPALEVPPTQLAQAAPMAAPQPAKNKPARAAASAPPADQDEPARNTASRSPPKDTRLAMANPAVPKDETRIERRPTDARDDLTRAGEAMSIGRTSDAIALLRKVILAEPDNERARLALLSLLAERGRDENWRSTLADSAKALPKRFGLAAAQGLAESGRFEDSLAILQGLPESIRDVRYFSALGATHQQLNQHTEAVAAFDAALGSAAGSSPQLPSLLVAQALSMQSLGKVAEARRNLERVRQMPEAAADMREFAARELAHSR